MPTQLPEEDSIVVRQAAAADSAALAQLAERTFRATFEANNTAKDMNAHCAAHYGPAIQALEIADPKVETLVAQNRQGLIGYGQLCWDAAPECVGFARPAEVRRLYVDERWHGRGVGRVLLERLLSRACDSDADAVWLGVWEHNPRALAFYEKIGFTRVGAHVFQLGSDPQRDLILVRPCGT